MKLAPSALLATAGLGALALAGIVSAQPAAPSSSTGPSALPPPEDREDKPLESFTFPNQRSTAPTEDEWKSAPAVRLRTHTDRANRCKATLVREYLRILCPGPFGGYRHVLGPKETLTPHVPMPHPRDAFSGPTRHDGHVTIALVRGEVHQFDFLEYGMGYDWVFLEAGVFVEAFFAEGAAHPTVTVR